MRPRATPDPNVDPCRAGNKFKCASVLTSTFGETAPSIEKAKRWRLDWGQTPARIPPQCSQSRGLELNHLLLLSNVGFTQTFPSPHGSELLTDFDPQIPQADRHVGDSCDHYKNKDGVLQWSGDGATFNERRTMLALLTGG